MNQHLIIVNENDEEIGYGEKMNVHRNAFLHRAFSIFVINSQDELLLQQRAHNKYHSGGLWTNTCCSHPIKGEPQDITIHRRLREEMGFDCELEHLFKFIYKVKLDNDLTEYECDHVYLGRFDGIPKPNPNEVVDYKWMSLTNLRHELRLHPQNYTYWLNHAFEEFHETYYNGNLGVMP